MVEETTKVLSVDASFTADNCGEEWGVTKFATSKDAMAAAMELGGATINVDGLNAESSYIVLNKAGDYTVTGGKGVESLLVRMNVEGDNVNLTFNDAYFRSSWCYRVSASNTFTVTNSVIGSAERSGAGGGWFTALYTPTRIENSIVGIKMEKFTDLTDAQIKAMPRSAEKVKAAVEAKTYTYLPYGDNHSGPHIGTFSEFTVEDSTVISGWISVGDRAIMSLDNSVLYLGASMGIGEVRVDGVTDTNLNGWSAQSEGWGASAEDFRVGKAAQVDITNSIVRNIGWGNGNPTASYIQVGGYVGEKGYAGILNITNSDVDLTGRTTEGTEVVSTSRLEVRDNGIATITGSTVTIETVKNEGTLKVTGTEASTIKANITGNALQLAGGVLEDSNIDGNIQVTGTSAMQGENTVANSVIKVSGGELTISGSLTGPAQSSSAGYPGAENFEAAPEGGYPADNKVFIQAGDDTYWGSKPGLANNGAGTINIAGDVFVSQANANSNGTINVQSGASLSLNTLCVENGKIADGKAGVLNIYGDTNAELIQVFNGGTINVYTEGELFTNTINKGRRQIIVGAESLLNVEGGSVKVETANATPGTETTKVGIDVAGTMQVSKGGSVEVGHFTDDKDWEHDAANTYINVTESGSIKVDSGSLKTTNLANSGTVEVSGTSDIKAAVSGSGNIYLTGAELDADTEITGGAAYVKAVSGTNTITDSKLTVKAFHVGDKSESSYLDKENGSNITLGGSAVLHVKGTDSDGSFGGWIGTRWLEKSEYGDFAQNNTARYKMTVTDDAVATFDYLQVAADGELYVSSKGEYKPEADSDSYAFYANRLLANGVVEFKDTTARLLSVYVSVDNPMTGNSAGELSFIGSSAKVMGYDGRPTSVNVCNHGVLNLSGLKENETTTRSSVSVWGDMIVEENATVNISDSTLTLKETKQNEFYRKGELNNSGTFNIAADGILDAAVVENAGKLNVTSGTVDAGTLNNSGDVTVTGGTLDVDTLANNGTVKVSGASTLDINAVTGNALQLADGAVLTNSQIFSTDYTKGGGEVWVSGNVFMNGSYNGNLTRVSGKNAKLTINGTYTATKGGYYQLTVGGTTGWHMDRYYTGSYSAGGELVVANTADVQVDCLSIVGDGKATVDGKVLVTSQFELSKGNIDTAAAGSMYISATGSVSGAAYCDIYGSLTVEGIFGAENPEANNGAITIHNGGSIALVDNGKVNIGKMGITNNGTITMDVTSSITADSITGNGTINICVDGFNAGSATVIDAKDGTADFGKVQFVDGDGKAVSGYATLIDKTNGDLIVYKTAGETIYVNAEWTGKTFGEAITYGDNTLYYGIDAFADMMTINPAADTTNLVIAGGTYKNTNGDYSKDVSLFKGNITNVTAADEVVVDKIGNLVFFADKADTTYTVSGDFKTTGYEGDVWVDGKKIGWFVNGIISFEGAKDVSGVEINLSGANFVAGSAVKFQDCSTVISADSSIIGVTTQESKLYVYSDVTNYGKIEIVNNQNPGTASIIKNGTFTVSGKDASVKIATNASVEANIYATGALVVEDKAKYEADGKVINAGTISIANATFTAGTITNNGTVILSGKNEISTAINGGTIIAVGETEIVDNGAAEITGATLNVGQKLEDGSVVKATVKVNAGTVDVEGIYGVEDGKGVSTVYVADNATLNATGFGFAALNVDGTANFSQTVYLHDGGVVADGATFSADGGVYVYSNYTVNGTMNIVANEAMGDWFQVGDGKNAVTMTVSGENAEFKAVSGKYTLGGSDPKVVAGSTLTVSNGAKFIYDAEFKNDGTINIENAELVDIDSIVNNGTINIKGNSSINAAITGNVAKVAKGAVISLIDDEFTGDLASYTAMIDLYNIANLASVNGSIVSGNATAGYSVKVGNTIYSVTDGNASGLIFTQISDANGQVEKENYNGSIDGLTNDYVVEAKSGTATLKVSKGQSATVAEITKNEKGGVTNLNLQGNLTVGTSDNHGSIEAVGKITTGNNVEVKMGEVSGTNLNSTINLGKNNEAYFDNIDMMGGKNTLKIGSNSYVEVDDSDNANADGYIQNVKTIKLANGTAANAKKGTPDVFTTLNVEGDIVAPAMKNSITLGNYAMLTVGGDLVNDDVNVGTTIKAGKNSTVDFEGDVKFAAGINMGANSTFEAGVVTGTAGNDTFAFGGTATMTSVDMKAGKNTFKAGANADIDIDGNLLNVNKVTVAKGAELDIDGILEGTAKNDTITFANDAAYGEINGITLGDGNDKLAIGNNVVFNVGNYDSVGNNLNLADINFGDGNNTMTLGKNASVNAGNLIFGEGVKDTLTLGADSVLRITGIEGVETIKADKSSVMIIDNGKNDVNFDAIEGTWDKATIIDLQGELTDWANGEISGAVYANGREFDSLEFSVTDSNVNDIRVDDISEGIKIELWQKDAEGNWTFYANIPSNDFSGKKDLEIGDYAIAVKVDGNDTEKKDYSFNAYLA